MGDAADFFLPIPSPRYTVIKWISGLGTQRVMMVHLTTGSLYNSCGPICLIGACSNPSLCYLLSDERSLLIPPYLTIFPTPPPFPPPLLTRLYSMTSRTIKQVGPQLLYGLPVIWHCWFDMFRWTGLMELWNNTMWSTINLPGSLVPCF